MTSPSKRWPSALAEATEVAREYLQGGYGRADTALLARDFAEVILKISAACVVGLPCDRHAGMVHGQEAEELRAGVEQILSDNRSVFFGDADSVLELLRTSLRLLLDRIDARDSLAFLGSTVGSSKAEAAVSKEETSDEDAALLTFAKICTVDGPIAFSRFATAPEVQRDMAARALVQLIPVIASRSS